MKKSMFILIVLSLSMLACKNDKVIESDKASSEEITQDNIKNLILNDDIAANMDTALVTNQSVTDSKSKEVSTIKETEEVKKAKEKLTQKKEEEIEKKMQKSTYKEMNCTKMIIKYKNIIEEFKKTGNEELLLWKDTNDPIYKFCYEKHTTVFDSLERLENEIGNNDEIY